MIGVEHHIVCEGEEVISAHMLKAYPDKYGGLGSMMAEAIARGVITIPLSNGCYRVSIQTANSAEADRIINDGGVDRDDARHQIRKYVKEKYKWVTRK